MARPAASSRSWGALGQLLQPSARPASTTTTTFRRTLATTPAIAARSSRPADKAEDAGQTPLSFPALSSPFQAAAPPLLHSSLRNTLLGAGPVPAVDAPEVRQLRRLLPQPPQPSVADAPEAHQLRRLPPQQPQSSAADSTREVPPRPSPAPPPEKAASRPPAPVESWAERVVNRPPSRGTVPVIQRSPVRRPKTVTAMMPTLYGELPVKYRMDDIVRLAKGYRNMRSVINIDSLTAKFLTQKRFELQQIQLSSDRRRLRGTEPGDMMALSGLRGIPVLKKSLPDDWDKPKRSKAAGLAQKLLPRAMWRGLQRVRRAPTRHRIPLTVRRTTHNGAMNARMGAFVTVPAPPMTADLHPGLPLAFLPTRPALLALEKPLFKLSALPRAEQQQTTRFYDREVVHLRTQREGQTSPAYVARVRALARESADPRVAALAEILLRKPADKLDPNAAIARKTRTDLVSIDGVNHVPAGHQVLSIGLYVPVGKKGVHPVACVRSRVQRKTRDALCEALKLDFAKRGATPAALERWQQHIFHIVPNPMIKLLPVKRLVGLMRCALNRLHQTLHPPDAPHARATALGPSGRPSVTLRPEAADRAVRVELLQQALKLKTAGNHSAKAARPAADVFAVGEQADRERRALAVRMDTDRQKALKGKGPAQTMVGEERDERERLRQIRLSRWEATQAAAKLAGPAAQGKGPGAESSAALPEPEQSKPSRGS